MKKTQYVSKNKIRPFTLTIRRDLIFVKLEAWFFTKAMWPSFMLPGTLVWLPDFLIRMHATAMTPMSKVSKGILILLFLIEKGVL